MVIAGFSITVIAARLSLARAISPRALIFITKRLNIISWLI